MDYSWLLLVFEWHSGDQSTLREVAVYADRFLNHSAKNSAAVPASYTLRTGIVVTKIDERTEDASPGDLAARLELFIER